MLKKLLKILLFPFFIFAFLYGLGEILGILFLATIFYGLLIYAIIQDPTFGLNKLLYFLAVTLAFIIMIYFEYFYNEEKNDDKTNNPIEQDTEAMMSFNN
jgi:zinc transporter ZupT